MAILQVQGLTKNFKGLRAVNNVSFSIEENEIFGMIGPNGSGKTTIFNLISNVFEASSGSILFENRELTGLQSHIICRRGVGRTYQIAKPFLTLSVLENVMIGALNRTDSVTEARKRALKILSEMGLDRKIDSLGKDLTVPERKRLELSRALATEPKLLLLDEVMAGLNPAEVKDLIALLRGLGKRGIALFIIEHIMQAIMDISHRILVLHHGEKIALGTPREVAGDEKVIEAYLGEEYSFA